MVLNHKYNVSFSKETVEKIERIAKEMGYTIPKRRQRKESRKGKLIIVFCPTLTNPYYVMLLQGIEAVAKEEGYSVFTCNTQRELKLEEQYLKLMSSVDPAGIIYTCNPSSVFMEQVGEIAKKIPLVIISNREKVQVDAINQDNTKVGRLMARHLLDYGHRDVAFITPPLTQRQKQRSKRVQGFVQEYEQAGLGDRVVIKAADASLDEQLPSPDSEYKMGYNLTKELLAEYDNLTAIAGLNDMMAFGIMDALQEEKYKNVVLDTHQYLMMAEMMGCEQTVEGYEKYVKEHFMKEIEEMQQYFPVICGEWCLFNSLACGWDTKGGQTVLNGLEGASVEKYTPEQKKEIYQAVARMQKEAWDKGAGYFYWSYKLLTDTVNTEGWVGWDSWDLGRCVDFGWFPLDK